MSEHDCIVCLELKDNLYKCDRCITYLCESCYIEIKNKNCPVCRLDIFNKKLYDKDYININKKGRKIVSRKYYTRFYDRITYDDGSSELVPKIQQFWFSKNPDLAIPLIALQYYNNPENKDKLSKEEDFGVISKEKTQQMEDRKKYQGSYSELLINDHIVDKQYLDWSNVYNEIVEQDKERLHIKASNAKFRVKSQNKVDTKKEMKKFNRKFNKQNNYLFKNIRR